MTDIDFLVNIHPQLHDVPTAEPSLREIIRHYYRSHQMENVEC